MSKYNLKLIGQRNKEQMSNYEKSVDIHNNLSFVPTKSMQCVMKCVLFLLLLLSLISILFISLIQTDYPPFLT